MSNRNYPDFLTAYLEYTEHTEPPLNYHIWTALSVIGGVLQRRTYLKWGFKYLYPNMYVVLIGPSGARKGTAMGVGKDLLSEISGISITAESITREQLIRNMRECVATFMDPTTETPKYHCSITVLSEELSVFLGQSNIKFLADLTDWFDCHDQWTYSTKGSGTDKLTGVCVNILGATAPDWLRSILPQEAFGGGFTSRIIFVVEEGKRHIIPDPTLPPHIIAMRPKLLNDLEQMALMCGEMRFTNETMEIYKNWYTQQSKNPVIRDPHFAGYCERRAVHTLKLSMVCSASRSSDRIIHPEDFERSCTLLSAVEPKMPRAFLGLGKARYSEMTAHIFDYLQKVKTASNADILNKFHLDLDEYTLGIIMKTLSARKVIQTKYSTSTGESTYTLLKGELPV